MKKVYPEKCPICKEFNCDGLSCQECNFDTHKDGGCLGRCNCNTQEIYRHLKQQINIQKEYNNNLECIMYYYYKKVCKS